MIHNQRYSGGGEITLKDVIVHMQHMEQRLVERIVAVEKATSKNSAAIKSLELNFTKRMDRLENRIDALDEDLTATIKDSIAIRRHVGMPV